MISGPNGAANTWNQLDIVSRQAGKPEAAELWHRKAIEANRSANDKLALGKSVNNLANLLQNVPGRLTEARQLEEEALVIKKTLDPRTAEIWTTYGILADIAEREATSASDSLVKAELLKQASEYRRLPRDAKRKFAGTRYELRKHASIIVGAVLAVQQPEEVRTELEQLLSRSEGGGRMSLIAEIRKILEGERNADELCESLNYEDSMIIEAILQGLDDPSSLKDLLPDEEQEEQDST